MVLSISGKKNKLRCYYLSWLKNKFLSNSRSADSAGEKTGFTPVGDVEGCTCYKLVKFERLGKTDIFKSFIFLRALTTFFRWRQIGRSITVAPDKIFAQTFFEGKDKCRNCGLVGVSITSGNRKCPKNRKLSEKP